MEYVSWCMLDPWDGIMESNVKALWLGTWSLKRERKKKQQNNSYTED